MLTPRVYFAGQAMAALIGRLNTDESEILHPDVIDGLAIAAFKYADAMLKANSAKSDS